MTKSFPNKSIFLLIFLFFMAAELSALDVINLWRHPEIADKNSLFVDIGIAPLVFDNIEFNVFPLEIRVDYLPPLPLPFFLGVFLKTPNPNFKSFGLRVGYHFDLYDPFTDLYFVYSFDFGYVRNDILQEYNDTPAAVNYYDFRFGIRRFFGSWFGIAVETGFKFESIVVMLSIKIN